MATFFIMQPVFMLSGFAVPIRNMPDAISHLTYLNPLRYYMDIVRGVFLKGSGEALPQVSVPNSALVQLEGRPVVFRQEPAGALAPVEVRPGAVIGDRTLIEEGLAPDDVVVVDGAFVLKAQLLKAQLGEGHAH